MMLMKEMGTFSLKFEIGSLKVFANGFPFTSRSEEHTLEIEMF
jgi:hypothetical protein